ncbi:MAG: type II CRISPR-associated endonuclease Cas1 [Alphaproteobacteria bacterium]|nr:type II CRISPR-associated endonuclease Cas1 [Alphaproteobacteria bacterium]
MTASPLGRIIEIAEDGRHLAKERGFLTVTAGGSELGRVPLDDLAAVVATAQGTSASTALLAELAQRGIAFVLCGRNFAPAALLWPVAGHHAQQRRMEAQIERSRPLSKRLWALLVAAKVRRQGWALAEAGLPSGAFVRLAREVRAGDPDNIEAQAARRYWPLLMGEGFRRDPNGDGANALLNYGYAVLRAATARAISASGLHPGIGIFHRHPYNAMPLADDLMEPFRPIVDLRVCALVQSGLSEVTTEAKRDLAAVLMQEEPTAAGISPVSTCLLRLGQSLAESYLSGAPVLDLPLLRLQSSDAAEGSAGNAPE